MPEGWTLKAAGKFLPDTRVSARIPHVGIIVTNLGAAMAFYQDILGCKETWRGGGNPKKLSWVNLKVPDGEDYIEFMLYAQSPAPDKRGRQHHLCLEVADVDKAKAVLEQRVARIKYDRPLDIQTGINKKRQLNLWDPDGTRVELMEPHTVDGSTPPSSTAPPPEQTAQSNP
jgi:lactoylglutathione lyase